MLMQMWLLNVQASLGLGFTNLVTHGLGTSINPVKSEKV